MGCLAIVLFFAGLVGVAIGVGPSTVVFEGIEPIRLGAGKWVFLVLGAGAILAALVVFARSRR